MASTAAAVPLGAWWTIGASRTPTGGDVLSTPTSFPAPDATGPTPTTSTAAPPASSPTTPPTVPAFDHELVTGIVDRQVGTLQQRLIDLAFDPGPVDDYFGGATLRSVWAFQKLVMGTPREDADGVVMRDVWDRLNGDVDITPRRTPGGTHLEVYLPEQLAVLFDDGTHVSSPTCRAGRESSGATK